MLIVIHPIWWPFRTLSLDSSTSVPLSPVVTLLDFFISNYRSNILMQSCFAFPWHIVPIIRCTIWTCFLSMFSGVSWTHPVLLCTPSKNASLLFLLWSHLCQNWYLELAPDFSICFDQSLQYLWFIVSSIKCLLYVIDKKLSRSIITQCLLALSHVK